MDFTEDEDISALKDSIRRFVRKRFPPTMLRDWEKTDNMPRSVSVTLAELGLAGMCVPQEYGGLGRRVMAMATTLTELSRWSTPLASLFNMGAGYGALNISESGTDDQKRKFLPQLLAGEMLVAYGLSEPMVGADLADVQTTARRHGDRVFVHGTKRWVTGASLADYIYTLVRTGHSEDRRKNLTFVLVPTNAAGVTITPIQVMGSRGLPTNDVVFEDVEVPFDLVVGGEAGWNNAWSILTGPTLEIEKIAPSAIALGIAEAALEEAWEYSQQRVQGGKVICAHQTVRHVLADAQAKIQTCRLMLSHAAWLVETGRTSAVATSMAKLHVCESARDIVLNCQQYVMGAYGYAEGFNMERYVRDVLATPIVGGSTGIQRNNIANLMKLPKD
ncbi:acyl-CoA dehydrogenase family protein [Paraburkholderia oxyphila]|uniref:acyl-CoA dehydrogenase family protein n=1 Tax=Paraburkholderia oxyphila TaxID=614212 RepID=UPI0004863AA7|nr:acyl-CoA dehydrogenase family protein [Paraburkholderia oxyphila]